MDDDLKVDISISFLLIIALFLLMVFSSRYAHAMEEHRPSIIIDIHDNNDACRQEEDLRQFRTMLCDYAVKELMERIHEEENGKISQKRQKWIAIGVGTVTTITPLAVAIIQAIKE